MKCVINSGLGMGGVYVYVMVFGCLNPRNIMRASTICRRSAFLASISREAQQGSFTILSDVHACTHALIVHKKKSAAHRDDAHIFSSMRHGHTKGGAVHGTTSHTLARSGTHIDACAHFHCAPSRQTTIITIHHPLGASVCS